MNKTKTIDLPEPRTIAWYDNQILYIVFLVFVSGILLLPGMRGNPVNSWDEARHAVNALEMVQSGNWITVTYNHEPDFANIKFPLGAWLIAINYKLFGINEFSLRLWSVVFTISTTVLVYLFGSLIKNRWLGVLAGLIFITSMQVIVKHAGITGDYDAGASFFVTLSLFLFLLFYKTEKRGFLFSSMAAIGLGIMYKSFVPGLIPLFIISTFLLFSKKRKIFFNLKMLSLCVLIIIGIISPWLILRSASDSSFFIILLNSDYWQRLTTPVDNHGEPFWFYLGQMGTGFFPWIYLLPFGLFAVFRGYKKNKNEYDLFLLIWFFTIFLLFSLATTKNFWYMLPIFPAMALIVAIFWQRILELVRKMEVGEGLFLVTVIFLIFGIVAAFLNVRHYLAAYRNKDDFLAFISQEPVKKELVSADMTVVHISQSSQSHLFYLKRLLGDKFVFSQAVSCELDNTRRFMVKATDGFLSKYLETCPERKIVGRYGENALIR